MLNYIWSMPGHREAFIGVSRDMPTFIVFANGIINHSKLLEDALNHLPKIRAITEEQRDTVAWAALTEEAREAKLHELEESRGVTKNSLLLANETVAMLSYLTEHIKEPFLCPELKDRLASLLMGAITRLTGKRGRDLKVDNPGQYRFEPLKMLLSMCKTVLHLAGSDTFVQACVSCLQIEEPTLRKAASILRRKGESRGPLSLAVAVAV